MGSSSWKFQDHSNHHSFETLVDGYREFFMKLPYILPEKRAIEDSCLFTLF